MCGEKEFHAESSGIEPHPEVPVRFYGGLAVSVYGLATKRIYRFSYENPVQAVDARDVVSIVKTGLFRQVL